MNRKPNVLRVSRLEPLVPRPPLVYRHMWFTSYFSPTLPTLQFKDHFPTSHMKDIIRQRSIDLRKQLSSTQVDNLSEEICLRITKHKCFRDSEVVAIYHPFVNEVSLLPLLEYNKYYLLPGILSHNRMQFKHFNNSEQLEVNQYGILEPKNEKIVQHKDIDLCLLPLTSFDRTGQRLGMGAGYYDRYFELNQFQKKPTILAGVAYNFQENDTIPSEAWDIPLDIIFTNHETIEI